MALKSKENRDLGKKGLFLLIENAEFIYWVEVVEELYLLHK